eukprot:13090354-Alexandrium_andersonii.AAC.1
MCTRGRPNGCMRALAQAHARARACTHARDAGTVPSGRWHDVATGAAALCEPMLVCSCAPHLRGHEGGQAR